MKRFCTSHLTGLPKHGSRAALVAILLGAILAFGAFSFAPPTHAASANPGIATTARIEIITHRALSVRVAEVSNPMEHCYNTPSHTVTITELAGRVAFTGYAHPNCAGAMLCEVFPVIPPSGFLILSLC